jgi:hypothetical protein
MPRDGSNVYTTLRNWPADAANGTPFSPALWQAQDADFAAALNDLPVKSTVLTFVLNPATDPTTLNLGSITVSGSTWRIVGLVSGVHQWVDITVGTPPDLSAYSTTATVTSLLSTYYTKTQVDSLVGILTGGAPGALDTFLEAYNRFVTDEALITGLTTVVNGKQAALGFTPATAARAIGVGGLATGGGDLSADRTITVPKGVGADVRAGTDDAKALTSKSVWDSAAEVALGFSSSMTPDFATGINFAVILTGGATLNGPTNAKPGQAGYIAITQDTSGSRVLSFGSGWKFIGGAPPTVTPTAGAVDFLFYQVRASGNVVGSLSKDIR